MGYLLAPNMITKIILIVLSNTGVSTYADRNSSGVHGKIHPATSMVTSYFYKISEKYRKHKILLIQAQEFFYRNLFLSVFEQNTIY